MQSTLITVVLFFYLFFVLRKQKKQLSHLELKLAELQMRLQAKTPDDVLAQPEDDVTEPSTEEQSETIGPWAAAETTAAVEPIPTFTQNSGPQDAPENTPSTFIFRKENLAAAIGWLKENWFYAVAALCLALSGVFLVQYGVENGLLTPFWRVMGALALGTSLIGAGEWVRRKSGDGADSHTAYLPSTLSGAGLVALFAGVLSARQMYGLIGAETALVGLVGVSIVATVLGWFYGPFLAVVGVLGATTAPFLIGGSSDAPQIFFYYFALIILTALLIDTIKRWAWPSGLALIFGYIGSILIFSGTDGDVNFIAFALITLLGTVAIPVRQIWPNHMGTMVLTSLFKKSETGNRWPEFPTRLVFGAFVAAAVAIFMTALTATNETEVWLALASTAFLFLCTTIWFRSAPALTDLTLVPPTLFLGIVATQSLDYGPLFATFRDGATRVAESAPPATVLILLIGAIMGSALAFGRGMAQHRHGIFWIAIAALTAPLTVVTLEVFWAPETVLGTGRWAAYALAIAALMTFFAERIARHDGTDHRRAAILAVAAATMISFALTLMLSQAALTIALAVMVVLSALVDRKFDLRLLSVFAQLGVIVVGWRLIVDPGVFWAYDAGFIDLIFAYLGSIGLLAAAWAIFATRARSSAIIITESAIWSLSAVFLTVLIFRVIDDDAESFWGISLVAMIWLISAGNQFYRLKAGGKAIRWVRLGLGSLFSLIGMALLFVVTTVMNPLDGWGGNIEGPLIFDTLLVGYGLPAVLFAVLAWKLTHIRSWIRKVLFGLSVFYTTVYVGLEIRRFWRGDQLSVPGTTDPELYTYTVAMLLASVALLFFAFSRRSRGMYRFAIIGVGLTIAKVFLVDMAGLAGLIRVSSFLGLGLSLSALAWVNGRMKSQWEQVDSPVTPPQE